MLEVPAASAFSRNDSRSGSSSSNPPMSSQRTSSGAQRSQAQSAADLPDPGGMNRLCLSDLQAPVTAGRGSMRQGLGTAAKPALSNQGSAAHASGQSSGFLRDASPASSDHAAPLDVNADGEPVLAAQDLVAGFPAPNLPRMFRHGSTDAAARNGGLFDSSSAPPAAAAAPPSGSIGGAASAVHPRSSRPSRAGSLGQPSRQRSLVAPVVQGLPFQVRSADMSRWVADCLAVGEKNGGWEGEGGADAPIWIITVIIDTGGRTTGGKETLFIWAACLPRVDSGWPPKTLVD